MKFLTLSIVVILYYNCAAFHDDCPIKDAVDCSSDDISPGASFIENPEGGSTSNIFGILGDVNDVLKGVILEHAKCKIWDQTVSAVVGIGAATLNIWQEVGETLFINGLTIVRNAHNESDVYYETEVAKRFKTQFSVFIQPGAQPDGDFHVNYKAEGGITLSELYEQLINTVSRRPVCFYGVAQFENFKAIALSKAPVYGDPLFGDTKKEYYANDPFNIPNEYGLLVGCAADFSVLEDEPELLNGMSQILYRNPLDDVESSLEAHTHAATLNKCMDSTADIKAIHIKDAYHMLSDAVVNFAKIHVFVAKDADSITRLNKAPEPLSRRTFGKRVRTHRYFQ